MLKIKLRTIWQALLSFSLVLLLALYPSVLGLSQDSTAVKSNSGTIEQQEQIASDNKIDGFPVVLDGKTILIVRRGVGAFSAEERANAIQKRLENIAQDDSLSIDNLKIISDSEDDVTYLTLNKQVILTITPQDARAYRTPRDKLAEEALQKIKDKTKEKKADEGHEHFIKLISGLQRDRCSGPFGMGGPRFMF